MELLEGFKLIELTETRIVQEKILPTGGKVRLIGNPNPDPVKREKAIRELSEHLLRCEARIIAEEQAAKGQQ